MKRMKNIAERIQSADYLRLITRFLPPHDDMYIRIFVHFQFIGYISIYIVYAEKKIVARNAIAMPRGAQDYFCW